MINALLAHSFRAAEMLIPWQIVPMVILGLFAVCAMFKGIYWIVGKVMPEDEFAEEEVN